MRAVKQRLKAALIGVYDHAFVRVLHVTFRVFGGVAFEGPGRLAY
jgi:hypothetical protein